MPLSILTIITRVRRLFVSAGCVFHVYVLCSESLAVLIRYSERYYWNLRLFYNIERPASTTFTMNNCYKWLAPHL